MGATRHYFARYVLPLVPFLALFAADAVVALASWLRSRMHLGRQCIIVVLAVVIVAQPLAWSVRHGVLLTRTDSRTLAKEWIEANIPPGARFALDWPVYSPPLSRDLYAVKELGLLGLAQHDLEWYRENEFNYLVTSNYVYGLTLLEPIQAEIRRAFYASVSDQLDLVAEINPYTGELHPPIIFEEIYGPATNLWLRERPGPVLRVYRVQ
jgi:hypothetical protein